MIETRCLPSWALAAAANSFADVLEAQRNAGQRTYRSITVDGEEIEAGQAR
jgi:hypothetical protein